MAQINGNIFCVHGLEASLLLKCPYYSKQSNNGIFQSYKRCNSKICMKP